MKAAETEIAQRQEQLLSHVELLKTRYPEPARRIAVAALKGRLYQLQENSRSFASQIFIKGRSMAATWLLRWVPDLVIEGYLPGRIGRYLTIDSLIFWSEQDV